jgi:hypothetical protein
MVPSKIVKNVLSICHSNDISGLQLLPNTIIFSMCFFFCEAAISKRHET